MAIQFSLDRLYERYVSLLGAHDEYVLFGSSVLYLHGLRDADSVGDLDVFVSKRVWAWIFEHATDVGEWEIEIPRAGDPPFLSYDIVTPIHLFYEWTARDAWISAEECMATAEIVTVDGVPWRCTPLDVILRHKQEAYRNWTGDPRYQAKHVRDIATIERHLAGSR